MRNVITFLQIPLASPARPSHNDIKSKKSPSPMCYGVIAVKGKKSLFILKHINTKCGNTTEFVMLNPLMPIEITVL